MPLSACARLVAAALLVAVSGPPATAADDPHGSWPLTPPPVVLAPFDPPSSEFGAGHRGVDLAGRTGSWIRAALPGQVTFAGVVAGRGVVVVDHGATRTTYQPVAAVVRVGQSVASGQVLGLLELAGSHCAPAGCLHWGWIRGSTYLDPLRLVGASTQIRLLPWGGLPASRPAPTASVWASPVARWAQALGCACW